MVLLETVHSLVNVSNIIIANMKCAYDLQLGGPFRVEVTLKYPLSCINYEMHFLS